MKPSLYIDNILLYTKNLCIEFYFFPSFLVVVYNPLYMLLLFSIYCVKFYVCLYFLEDFIYNICWSVVFFPCDVCLVLISG